MLWLAGEPGHLSHNYDLRIAKFNKLGRAGLIATKGPLRWVIKGKLGSPNQKVYAWAMHDHKLTAHDVIGALARVFSL